MGYVAMAARDALQFGADRALQTLQLPVLGLRVADGEGDEPGPAATSTPNRTMIVRSFHARYFPTRSRCPVKCGFRSNRHAGEDDDHPDQAGQHERAHNPSTDQEEPHERTRSNAICHGTWKARPSGIVEPAMAPMTAGPAPVRND